MSDLYFSLVSVEPLHPRRYQTMTIRYGRLGLEYEATILDQGLAPRTK